MTRRRHLAGLLLALALGAGGGCVGGQGSGGPSAVYDRYVISADELAGVEVRTTALEVIQRMRPNWLKSRGPSGVRGDAAIVFYVNKQRMGESPLSRFTAGELLEIRFLNAIDATQLYGTGHGAGAILLTTR